MATCHRPILGIRDAHLPLIDEHYGKCQRLDQQGIFSLLTVSIFNPQVASKGLEELQLTSGRVISIPLPTYRLASSALRALQVDEELSPLVRRSFSLEAPQVSDIKNGQEERNGIMSSRSGSRSGNDNTAGLGPASSEEHKSVLRVRYSATTNRMLRVAVNGFMESLGVVLGVMQELDLDVLSRDFQTEKTDAVLLNFPT